MELTLQERRIVQGHITEGISRCTSKIEKMSGTPWGLMNTGTAQMSAVGMLTWFRRSREEHLAVQFYSESEILIEILLMYSEGSARAITERVTAPYGERLSRMENLVPLTMGEVSNVLGQGVVGSLADAFGRPIILSVPHVRKGPKVDLLAEAFASFDGRKDTLLLSHVELYSEKLAAECSVVIIVDTKNVRDHLTRLPAWSA